MRTIQMHDLKPGESKPPSRGAGRQYFARGKLGVCEASGPHTADSKETNANFPVRPLVRPHRACHRPPVRIFTPPVRPTVSGPQSKTFPFARPLEQIQAAELSPPHPPIDSPPSPPRILTSVFLWLLTCGLADGLVLLRLNNIICLKRDRKSNPPQKLLRISNPPYDMLLFDPWRQKKNNKTNKHNHKRKNGQIIKNPEPTSP
jgi:hypothetical protein